MDEQNMQFTPETVDEQVDKLLQSQDTTSQDVQIVQGLYRISTEDVGSLDHVWQRLGLNTHLSFSNTVRQMNTSPGQIKDQVRIITRERKQNMLLNSNNNVPKHQLMRNFVATAALLVAVLLIGSALLIFNGATHSKMGTASPGISKQPQVTQQQEVKTPSGVYVGGDNGIARIDTQTGKQIWKYDYPATHMYSKKILAIGDTVYVGMASFSESIKSAVLAIDAQTGKLHWLDKLDGGTLDDLSNTGDMLYTATTISRPKGSTSAVYVLKIADGTQYATYQFDGELQTLSVANNVLYVGATNGLYALSSFNGKPIWHNAMSSSKQSGSGQILSITTPHIVNGVLYTAITNVSEQGNQSIGVVAAFKTSTGEKIWQSDNIPSQLFDITVTNDKVFVGTMTSTTGGPFKGGLRAYDAQSGKLAWNTGMDGAVEWAPAIDNNLVYVPVYPTLDQQEEIAALNIGDGSVKWTAHVAAGIMTTPTVVNGVVYVATSNRTSSSTITALKAADGGQIWTNSSSDITGAEALMTVD